MRGCMSSVWLVRDHGPDGTLRFRGGSDAQIVAGLVAIVLARYSGRNPEAILSLDPASLLMASVSSPRSVPADATDFPP